MDKPISELPCKSYHIGLLVLVVLIIQQIRFFVFVDSQRDAISHDAPIPTVPLFDISNPVWPEKPPTLKPNCHVQFRDDRMSLCYVTPWPNFGDELGPPVTKRILELYFGCSAEGVKTFDLKQIYRGSGGEAFLNRTNSGLDTCFMVVGSLWRMVKSGDHIWGAGVADHRTIQQRCLGRHAEHVENITVYSSRGPKSALQIEEYCTVNNLNTGDNAFLVPTDPNRADKPAIEGAGDAGFLVPFLFPEHRRNISEIQSTTRCIVPHKQDQLHPEWHKLDAKNLTVDIGWIGMTIALQSCSSVVSSSLHGIILAEALGIPSRRLVISARPGHFKFSDFYASLRGDEPIQVTDIATAFANTSQPLHWEERDAYAKRILKTFPMDLFHVVRT